jgi:hypothetical protein
LGEKSDIIAIIKSALEKAGVRVETSPKVQGRAEVKHSFDLVATKGEARVPIDVKVAKLESVELRDLMETYAKSLDTKLKPAVVVAVPNASSETRKSAAAFGVLLVEGSSEKEVVESLTRVVVSFLA